MKTVTIREVIIALTVTIVPALGLAQSPGEAVAVSAPAPGAAPATAAVSPAAPRHWSFGGGLSYALFGYSLGDVSYASQTRVTIPQVAGTLERRLSERTWIVLGLAGNVARVRGDVPEGAYAPSRDDRRQVIASAGVRSGLTRPGAPVEISVVVLAQGGAYDGEQVTENRWSSTPEITRRDFTAWFAGASAGFAMERELTDGISLRVASPIVDARFERSSIRQHGAPSTRASTILVGAVLAPSLELRLQF